MKNAHTYNPIAGRIGRNNNVRPFTHTGTPEQADQAWLQYVRTYLSDPDANIRINGHPDAAIRKVVAVTPEHSPTGKVIFEREDTITTFETHLNDPTCNNKYDQEGNQNR